MHENYWLNKSIGCIWKVFHSRGYFVLSQGAWLGGDKIALIALIPSSVLENMWLQSVNPITWIRTIFAWKRLFSCVNVEMLFRVVYWLNNFLHSEQFNLLPTLVCIWFQSARLVANDFGHKSQELSFVIRTSQLSSWLAEGKWGYCFGFAMGDPDNFPFRKNQSLLQFHKLVVND